MKNLILTIILISNIYAISFEIINPEVKNGQTSLVKLEHKDGIVYDYVKVKDKKYNVFSDYFFVPVSYYEKPKELSLSLHYTQNGIKKSKNISIKVIDGNYKKETLSVDSSKIKLSKEDKKRAAKEYIEAMKIYNSVSDKNFIDSEYIMPIDSKITSDFGKARVFNGSFKSYHSGTDFRAKVGTPIKSANDGVVVLVEDRFYSGGSIIVDHGHGIYTCYYHMSEFDVKEGDKVSKGEVLGLSGVSGRVTGPHLHFSARVGGVQVDPLQFMKLVNKEL